MTAPKNYPLLVSALAIMAFSACNSAGNSPGDAAATTTTVSSVTLPGAPTVAAPKRSWTTDALVFSGSGTWSSEVVAIENLLTTNGLTFKDVNSTELDAMTLGDYDQFGLLIFPGGTGSIEAQSVSATTHANLRAAVQTLGVSYLGFCAGSFIAVAPAPAAGQDVSYGFGIVNGPVPNEFFPTDNPSAEFEMTLDSFADGTSTDLLWYGGPITPNTGVIAKYPTGEPAISEMWSGAGFVVLSGPHPTASLAILNALGVSPATPDTALAVKLIQAALNQSPLPTF